MAIDNEDRDIWKSHLEKEDYLAALNHCEHKKLPYAKKVAKLYANHLFETKEYTNAAIYYAKSDEKFEDVALKFLVYNQYEALKSKQ